LSILQMKVGDIEGFAETRRLIMLDKPEVLQNWNFYMCAVYLTGNYQQALEVHKSLLEIAEKQEKPPKAYELSELHLFAGLIYSEMKEFKKGMQYLEKKSKKIVDEVRKNEMLTQFYLKCNMTNKAKRSLETLLEINPNNKDYFLKMLQAEGVDVNKDKEKMLQLIE